jgi:thiosulfate dehydrogenase
LETDQQQEQLAKVLEVMTRTLLILPLLAIIAIILFFVPRSQEPKPLVEVKDKPELWSAPVVSSLDDNSEKALILYGRDLVINTAVYLGPKGKVAQISNGMNCQNCHLDAGTKIFGNNYSSVAANYPKFRERSGSLESIEKRVNDCFERSLNGKALDTASHEMKAMKAYIQWLGAAMPKGQKVKGSGVTELTYLDRAADSEKGKTIYVQKCQSCHSEKGEGKMNADHITYQYPPLWGIGSYNIGAGLYRLSRFAGYVKSNMPLGASYDKPQLTDEEAWDVAAFVNSQQRPSKDLSSDWPNISGKPADHPFGPYADVFSEEQHKYGPFKPIAAFYQAKGKK